MTLLYRSVTKQDIDQILDLYGTNLPYGKMDRNLYEYWFKHANKNMYFSRVLVDGEEIIGHNAFIDRVYWLNGESIKVKLSSGGMVKDSHSGVFYKLLKEGLKEFKDSIIIAFPNESSAPFFTKIFRFKTVEHNYFRLKRIDCKIPNNLKIITQSIDRGEEFIKQRIDRHPKNVYKRISMGDNYLIYKEFGNNEADILYVDSFSSSFSHLLTKLFEVGYSNVNIIHWDNEFIRQFGFEFFNNNIFVYNTLNWPFECQMIDSDIF